MSHRAFASSSLLARSSAPALLAALFALGACSSGVDKSGSNHGTTGGSGSDAASGDDGSNPTTSGATDGGATTMPGGDDATSPTTSGGDATAPGDDSGFSTGACDGGHTSVTGTTLAPNGKDPIPRAFAYITADSASFPAAPTGVACTRCVKPTAALVETVSGVDGTFTLTSPLLDAGGTYTVVVETGGFRHVTRHVTIPACGNLALPASATSFPKATSGDDIAPKVAVASDSTSTKTDVNDKFAQVLDAIGIGYDKIGPDRTIPASPAAGDMLSLLGSASALNAYQILVVPCGSLGVWNPSANLTSAMKANLQAWLAAGGRLYASDLAYAVVQAADPTDFTWAPGPSPHTLTTGTTDPASSGVGIASGTSINANVDDADLLAWLKVVGATTTTTIPVTELKDPWGALDSLTTKMDPTTSTPLATTYVSADVSWHEGSTTVGPAHHPLTAQVDVLGAGGASCGRAVFTSYHVQSSASGGALTPQERVLEYLFFQLTACLGNRTTG